MVLDIFSATRTDVYRLLPLDVKLGDGMRAPKHDKTGACLLAHAGVLRGAADCRYHQHKPRAHDPGQKPATPA